jgi:molybdopterin converting factor small subunit
MEDNNPSQDFKAFTVTLDTSNTYVLSDGYTIYVALSGIVTLPLLPSTGVTGFNIYVNDEDVRFLGGLDAQIKDGDSVTILPAVAGG